MAPDAAFPHFPRLPTEIRILIWNLAISVDSSPSIHFFSVFNPSDDQEWAAMNQHAVAATTRILRGVAAPRLGKNSRLHSWTWSNPSAYLRDSGL